MCVGMCMCVGMWVGVCRRGGGGGGERLGIDYSCSPCMKFTFPPMLASSPGRFFSIRAEWGEKTNFLPSTPLEKIQPGDEATPMLALFY